jgi:hypothetical protein
MPDNDPNAVYGMNSMMLDSLGSARGNGNGNGNHHNDNEGRVAPGSGSGHGDTYMPSTYDTRHTPSIPQRGVMAGIAGIGAPPISNTTITTPSPVAALLQTLPSTRPNNNIVTVAPSAPTLITPIAPVTVGVGHNTPNHNRGSSNPGNTNGGGLPLTRGSLSISTNGNGILGIINGTSPHETSPVAAAVTSGESDSSGGSHHHAAAGNAGSYRVLLPQSPSSAMGGFMPAADRVAMATANSSILGKSYVVEHSGILAPHPVGKDISPPTDRRYLGPRKDSDSSIMGLTQHHSSLPIAIPPEIRHVLAVPPAGRTASSAAAAAAAAAAAM